MASYLEFYDRGTGDLSSALTLSLGPGDVSSTAEYDLWNDKGAAQGADASTGLRLILEAQNGSGVWVRNGVSILDDLWATITIIGVDNTGDATFGPYTLGTRAAGAGSEIELPDLPADCAYQVDLVVTAPSDITTASVSFRLVAVDEANSVALTAKVGLLHPGVVPAWRDVAKRQIVDGMRITTSAGASVVVTTGLLDYDGTRVASLTATHTLNQNDSAVAALGVGESYLAVISVDSAGAQTATKGVKAVSPTAPTIPTDEVFVAYVTVAYDAGGTSVIEDGDIDYATRVDGDYLALAGVGLTVNIHGGMGLTDTSHYQFHGVVTSLSLDASDTSYIYRNSDGTFEDVLVESPPNTGSELMWEVDTDGAAVTAIRDRRVYTTTPIDEYVMRLEVGDITTTATLADWDTLPFDAELQVVRFEGKTNTAGSSGSYVLDINYADEGEPSSGTWTTIYTSGAGQRPTLAYDVTTLSGTFKYHEVRRFTKGQRLSVDVDSVPVGSPSLDGARAYLIFRRHR